MTTFKMSCKHARLRPFRRFIAALMMLAVTAIIYCLARFCPGIMFPWYQDFSKILLGVWCNISDLFPFSILEWSIIGAVWLVLGWTIRLIAEKKSPAMLLSTAAMVSSLILLIFVGLWGADQFAPTFVSSTPYTQTSYTKEEALEAGAFFLTMANRAAEEMPRKEDGTVDFGSFPELADHVESGYGYLAETYGSRFAVGSVTPKPMAFSYYMDCIGMTGLFTAYSGEMSINTDTPAPSLPYVISHECAHRTTVTQESDANFAAFLACIHSEDLRYQYSGWYSAFIYVYNAIAKKDKAGQSALWKATNEYLRGDILAANEHYAKFEKPVKKAAQKVNDSYLKSFNQSNGVNNYGAVAGPLMAWYYTEVKPLLEAAE